jgi:hypothetical protein
MLLLGTAWSYLNGYVLYFAAVVASYLVGGWSALLLWLLGYPIAITLSYVLELVFAMVTRRPVTVSETNFFNAYRVHAVRLGVTRDLNVSEDEIDGRAWKNCLADYAIKYPASVARFDPELAQWGALRAKLGLGLPTGNTWD